MRWAYLYLQFKELSSNIFSKKGEKYFDRCNANNC